MSAEIYRWRRNSGSLFLPFVAASLAGVLGVMLPDTSTAVRVAYLLAAASCVLFATALRRFTWLELDGSRLSYASIGDRHWSIDLGMVTEVRKLPGPKSNGIQLVTTWGEICTFGLTFFGRPREVASCIWARIPNANVDEEAEAFFAEVTAGAFDGKILFRRPTKMPPRS